MLKLLVSFVAGYLIGSVDWAIVIGKVFYHKDVRQYGSGNPGATNAGRVLGKEAFYIVSALDALKGLIVYMILNHFSNDMALVGALGVVIGHCYPLYFHFKGGKGVATTAGVILAIAINGGWKYFILQLGIPFILFVIILKTTQYMSLASMSAALCAAIMALIFAPDAMTKIVLCILTAMIIYAHRSNIQRLRNGTENKTRL